MATIYHGTPMTPRAALLDVCAGRAMCVSFYRPDDVEAVEAISPAIMFRQRRVFILESGNAEWAGVGRASRLDPLFRVVGAAIVSPRKVGRHSRYARSAITTQRRLVGGMAAWSTWCATVAHGRADRSAVAVVRQIRPGVSWLDWRGQGDRLPCVSGTDAGGRSGVRQSVAGYSHDARNCGGLRLPVHQRGQHFTGTEWMEV